MAEYKNVHPRLTQKQHLHTFDKHDLGWLKEGYLPFTVCCGWWLYQPKYCISIIFLMNI